MFGGDTKKEYYIARKHVFVFKVSLFYFFLFFQTSTRENVTFECDKKNKLFFPFFCLFSLFVYFIIALSVLSKGGFLFCSLAKKALCRHKKFITSLSHQYHVFGRNARAPFDGAAAKTKRREEEFIIIIFVVPVKSSDGDRGGVDVHLRDGDDIRRKDASSSAAGW